MTAKEVIQKFYDNYKISENENFKDYAIVDMDLGTFTVLGLRTSKEDLKLLKINEKIKNKKIIIRRIFKRMFRLL